LSAAMLDYFTVERLKQVLFECERQGLNAMQLRGDVFIRRLIHEYRREGGALQWVAQTATELADQAGHIRQLAGAGAAAIYHHGTRTDNAWLERKLEPVRELLAVMRDTGVKVGLGTHIPEVVEYAEEQGWDLDFYMTSCYCVSRKYRQSALVSGVEAGGEIFEDADRERMLDTVAACRKPCLVFKILGATRKCGTPEMVRDTFRHVFARIKPNDAVVVGMFPRDRNQVAENAALVREICAQAPTAT
jgi:hypothetical protein